MNQAIETLRQRLNQWVELTPEEWATYREGLHLCAFDRGRLITRRGEVENQIYFVISGIVKIYFVHGEREICVDFAFEQDLVNSFISFATRQPSVLALQAITPVEALCVSHSEVVRFNDLSKNSERLGRLIMEQLYIRKSRKEMKLLSQTAEERYFDLMTRHPEVGRQIPIKDIASYLGIHPESLSRIRKKMMMSVKK
ncbi:MAG: Crp/Fnr family transcriptional regulator [Cytophagaceae bacterium]|nr:Crp/Fnr family transcriptional regulator [Cytophagaceae bacterium]